ncbi:MAG: integrase, partial [Acidobacteria bacterium]
EAKRFMEAKVTGTPLKEKAPQSLANAVVVFLKDKQNQGITAKVIGKYTRELARLREFCESKSVFLVRDLTRELLTHYSATWADVYPASLTRSNVRERLRSFLRYCWESEWLTRIPEISRITVQQTPTLPLSQEEYARLLDTFWATFADDAEKRKRVHALVQLMRWSGLAIGDALTLDRNRIIRDATKDIYRIV